ncbi:MAG: hypothetical protein NTW87_27715 [Planctomycetota bacterium]|nr:hypothetical protein [Planctomycetota bacterium]
MKHRAAESLEHQVKRTTRRWMALAAALVLACSAAGSWAAQTDNHGIHAVPAPGKVAIDGSLDDWDLSGQILMCYDLESLKEIYSGQIAMMYDADSLYVSIHWKDPTPLGNCHDPRYQANKGWAGDCVQLRIKTDRICHVTAWCYSAKQEPAIHIDYGKNLNDPFGGGDKLLLRSEGWKLSDGAEMAFLKDADGRGYVQEMKLPWALITKEKKYAAGERFVCGVELLWGEADWPVHRYADNLAESATSREFFWTAHNAWGPVFLEAAGKLNLPTPAYLKALELDALRGPVDIAYELPQDRAELAQARRVTVAIDDGNGKRVRNLIAALPRKAGKNTEKWDGLDDNGKPVQPGNYTFKLLYHEGIRVNWIMSYNSPGNPSWDTSDGCGAFYGDHTAPQAVAAGGDFVALACPMGEAGKHLIGCDLTGQRLWGLANRTAFGGGHASLATDGKILWIANEDKDCTVWRAEIATGKYAPWQKTAKDKEGKEYQVLDLKVTEQAGFRAANDLALNLSHICLHEGALYVCLTRENKIIRLNATTGDGDGEVAVETPRAAAVERDGNLIVISGDKVLRVAVVKKAGAVPAFGAPELPGAYSVALGPDGNVYVSVRGKEHNVKVLAPDGKLVREIGKRGGRPHNGAFDENAMRNPAQIAIDGQNRLWVTEETFNPKRTSLWGGDGKLLKDFIGTTGYAGAGSFNPLDPTMAFSEDTVFKVDLEKGTWRPVWSLGTSGDPNDIFPPRADSHTRVIVRDGATYVFSTDTARGANEVHCTLLKDGAWRSAAHTGIVSTKKERVAQWEKYNHPLFNGHEGEAYAWADKNGDGLVQPDELTFAKPPAGGKGAGLRSYYWGQLPDEEGTIVYLSAGAPGLFKLPITGLTACGAPLYDIGNPQFVALDPAAFSGDGEGMIVGGSGGRVVLNRNPLTVVDGAGKILGMYPSRHVSVHGSHTAKGARPGYLIGPSSILGTADFGGVPAVPGSAIGEIFDLNGNLGENYLFTQDCLWVQALFKDTRGWFETPGRAVRGMPFDATTAGGESFGGNFVRTKDGKVYLTIGGTDARVLELTGFDTIRRAAGQFTYTPEQFVAAQKLIEENAAKALAPKTFAIAKATAPAKIDGKPDEWPALLDESKPALEIQESQQRRYGRVLARYDADNLYLAWRVYAPAGKMRNAGQDYRLLFKNGDCVDMMLGSSGGLRLLISAMADKPAVVLYEKTVPGTAEKDRVPFSSPWRTVYFDRVTQPDDIKVATGQAPGGYFVEAQVPWARLGVKPASGLKLKGDFGVLFADAGGTTTIARQYWSNKTTGLVNDVPGEAELAPNLWGEFVLE